MHLLLFKSFAARCSVGAAFAFFASISQAQLAFQATHLFGAGSDGALPVSAPVIDSNGNIYGTTEYGGLNGVGMVYEITAAGEYIDLFDFQTGTGVDSSGDYPLASATLDGAGDVLGTTSTQGYYGYGNVWKLTSAGFSLLHNFNAPGDGTNPYSPVTIDKSGNLFGTTYYGGSDSNQRGCIWELPANGPYTILFNFLGGAYGSLPNSGVTLDSLGNMFGTTLYGGINNAGMIYEYTTAGVLKDLYDFPLPSGESSSLPYAGVTLDSSGALYGTSYEGGKYGMGMIWTINSQFVDLHDFGSASNDGTNPRGGVTIDKSGNLFGTTTGGGAYQNGTIWEITSNGTYKTIFNCNNPAYPYTVNPRGGITLDAWGNLFTTVYQGGSTNTGSGLVFSLGNYAPSSVSASPNPVPGGTAVTGTVTLSGPAPAGGGAIVTLTSGSPNYVTVPATVVVPAGATSATFPIATKPYAGNYTAAVSASMSGVPVRKATLQVINDPVSSVVASPNPTVGSNGATGTVTLKAAAPAGGWSVNLTSSLPSYVSVPSSVIIPAGQSAASFAISTTAYPVTYEAVLKASSSGLTSSTQLTVQNDAAVSLSFSPNPTVGTDGTVATITLKTAAPTGGWTVHVTSSNPNYVGVPATVLIPSGQSSATFPVTTKAYPASYTATIAVNSGSNTVRAQVTVSPH